MAKRGANFIDEKTGEEFFFASFSTVFRGSGKYYKDSRTGKEIVNPANGNVLTFIDHPDYDPRKVMVVRKL